MDQPIKITAEVAAHDPATCTFVVDRPVLPHKVARFGKAEEAKGSPLAEAIFAIGFVIGVQIAENIVTVTKNGTEDWRTAAKAVAATIRTHLGTGQPAVSEEVLRHSEAEDGIRVRLEKILEERINPAVADHGGYVSLIDVKGSDVYIEMGGGCQGCGMANVTLRQGIEQVIRQEIPEVGAIVDVSDHTSGLNPYYPSH